MTDTPNNDARLVQGRKIFEDSLGVSADAFIAGFADIAPGFGELILESEFGTAYQRPGLDLLTRELIIVATCAMLGTAGTDAVKLHIPAALRAGATRAQVVEALVQISFSSGLPTAIGALQTARGVFAEMDRKAA